MDKIVTFSDTLTGKVYYEIYPDSDIYPEYRYGWIESDIDGLNDKNASPDFKEWCESEFGSVDAFKLYMMVEVI